MHHNAAPARYPASETVIVAFPIQDEEQEYEKAEHRHIH
jgi:hypothetical protein